jgi:carbon-monoxide dehydrogenase small subunit
MKGIFTINNIKKQLFFEPDERLLITLRRHGYTEVKNGCEEGECGACLVLLEGKAVNSCQILTASVIGKEIQTVKGIGDMHKPHPIEQAFADSGAIQCGFCTPGMVIATYALLKENPNPTDDEIKSALDGNLCRCTGYVKIIDAVRLAARYLQKEN